MQARLPFRLCTARFPPHRELVATSRFPAFRPCAARRAVSRRVNQRKPLSDGFLQDEQISAPGGCVERHGIGLATAEIMPDHHPVRTVPRPRLEPHRSQSNAFRRAIVRASVECGFRSRTRSSHLCRSGKCQLSLLRMNPIVHFLRERTQRSPFAVARSTMLDIESHDVGFMADAGRVGTTSPALRCFHPESSPIGSLGIFIDVMNNSDFVASGLFRTYSM